MEIKSHRVGNPAGGDDIVTLHGSLAIKLHFKAKIVTSINMPFDRPIIPTICVPQIYHTFL